MKRTSTIKTVIPLGWNPNQKDPAKAYNRWQRSIQRELDKIYNTNKADKYFI